MWASLPVSAGSDDSAGDKTLGINTAGFLFSHPQMLAFKKRSLLNSGEYLLKRHLCEAAKQIMSTELFVNQLR